MTITAVSRLKVGLLLPHAEGRYGGQTAGWTELKAMAQLAEQVGFDAVWTIDHFALDPAPGSSTPIGVWECWTLLAALAAVTERVELGPLVTPTSFRNPALLAKMVETIDEISGGRVVLGLGAGWVEREYRMLGLPFDHRVSRFEEALQIIHGLLRNGQVNQQGRYSSAEQCTLAPRGPRPQGAPIIIGSDGPRMLNLAARYADGWNAFFSRTGNTPEGVKPLLAKVDAACLEVGRDPATMRRSIAVFTAYDLPGAVGFPGAVTNPDATPAVRGTPQEIAARLREFADVGIDEVQIYLDPMVPAAVEAFAPALEALRALEASAT